MSLAKLTLRPPPNVDFVQGYPGIPPGAPDRPQAAVKGAIEVRVPPQGVKAKWVRIELRKVETLPGGGVANTYFDFVGQSPINVWQSNEEYANLTTQDFPFYIRIPESIPSSLALEKGAGIKYELIAAVCIKGKKGLLRRDKPTVTSTSSTIIIDKHELHSTWPVYQQPETRSHNEGALTLTVERSRTCYGPGDRVACSATVKSDALHTETLRGYEFTLRETTVFRGSPHLGKKGAPVVKVVHIGEQKVPVNVTLYGGTQHKAELTVMIPQQHTSATINAARHIDITYTLVVKAQMATGQHITIELPVVISNWPRAVSVEAMRLIGLAPNVSLPGHAVSNPPVDTPAARIAQPILSPGMLRSKGSLSTLSHPYASAEASLVGRSSPGQFNTAPPLQKTDGFAGASKPDEFGVNRPAEPARSISLERDSSVTSSTEKSSSYAAQTIGGTPSLGVTTTSGSSRLAPFASETEAFQRPRASSLRPPGSRLTVTNLHESELEEHAESSQAQTSGGQSSRPSNAQTKGSSRSRWQTAEEEKRRLYEIAVANVERVQGVVRPRSPTESNPSPPATPPAASASSAPAPTMNPSTSKKTHWPTAEEEKAMLFHKAQAAVARTQGLNGSVTSSPPPSLHDRSDSIHSQPPTISSHTGNSAGGPSDASSHPPRTPPSKSRSLQYSSADEEKAALKRYYEAKAAVDRTHSATYGAAPPTPPPSAPTAYDALFPSNNVSSPGSVPNDLPPPFVTSPSDPPYLSEKERFRRAYEAQDAAAAAKLPSMPLSDADSPPPFSSSLPTTMSPPPPNSTMSITDAVAEKEMLRRRFEAQDAAALAASGPPTPPPRAGTRSPSTPPTGGSRPIPVPPRSPPIPPGGSGGPRPLTAAEEKAKLKAMYEAEDRSAQPLITSPSAIPLPLSPPPVNGFPWQGSIQTEPSSAPPPLMPRPPKEYIQETQEEDMRTKARLQAIDKEISAAHPFKTTEVILSSYSADLVDSNGNPIPTSGHPPLPTPP